MKPFNLNFNTDSYKTHFTYDKEEISSHNLPPTVSMILSTAARAIEEYYRSLPPKLIPAPPETNQADASNHTV